MGQPWRALSLISGSPWGVGSKRRPGRETARDRSPGPLQGHPDHTGGCPWPLSPSEAVTGVPALCKPRDRTFGITKARWAEHTRVFLFIPGFAGGEFCLKAPSMHGHPGKVRKMGNPHFTTLTLQKDHPPPQLKVPFCALT